MFETFNNSLCVHASWLTAEFISKPNYDWMKSQHKIRVVRRGCRNTPALVEYISIPAPIRQKIIDKVGNPLEIHQKNSFENKLKLDDTARRYFANHTTSNGKGLPSKRIEEYVANAVILNALSIEFKAYKGKRSVMQSKDTSFWNKMIELITGLAEHTYPHALPLHPRRLKAKLEQYEAEGYECLIHAGYANINSEKINPEAQMFMVAQYANQVNRISNMAHLLEVYNAQAIRKGWKVLKNETTLHIFLHKPAIKPLWYGARYGEQKAKEKYQYQHSRLMPTMRDSLWFSDGTKLNLYYQNEEGKMATLSVYEVMDAYSNVLLGYHVSKTENYEAQYFAYKMAAKFSGHRPYEIKYDNQGGHKKLQSANFLTKLARLSVSTQPYNGKSKTIENTFGRFQQQILKRYWNFTGMNIQTKKVDNKANMEFIMANVDKLPTQKELIAMYDEARNLWNNSKHHITEKSLLETYQESINPETPKLELWDIVDLFWLTREDTIKCNAYGITFKENKVPYTYMVADQNGYPDLVWLRNNVDKSFIIKYDPQDRTTIYLYEESPMGPRFVSEARTKVKVAGNKQEQSAADLSFTTLVNNQNKEQRLIMKEETRVIQEAHGTTPEQQGFVTPRIKGVEKSAKKKSKVIYEDYDKVVSNITEADEYVHWNNQRI